MQIGLGTIVFAIFLFLKLAGIGVVATWSWLWVTSPLWIGLALFGGVALIGLIFSAAAAASITGYSMTRRKGRR